MPPIFPSCKFNFDTAIRDTFSAQAVVCRNHQGHIIHMISQISPPCLPNYGEALAARLAASLACSLNSNNYIIEGDSQVVISSLQHPQNPLDWRISPIIYDIIGSIPASISWSVRKVNRSANFCAHAVAHWAAAKSFSGRIPTVPPPLSSVPIVSGKDPPPTSLLGL
jgi:hypothetical protein